jgi:signal transduction histidine kinase
MIDRLVAIPALAEIPREQLQWLLDNGEIRRAEDGAEIRADDTSDIKGLLLMISGRFSVRVEQGGAVREMRQVLPGVPTGWLPYSRMTSGRGYLVAEGPAEYLYIPLEDLPAMTAACYEFTALCVHEMIDRVRVFKADDKRQEKMAALGRLSAGLAHELNNPASAAAAAARAMDAARIEMVAAAHDVGAAGLEGEAIRALDVLETATRRAVAQPVSSIERGDCEDRIAAWLDEHGIDPGLADPLADCGLDVADLDTAAPAFAPGQLGPALRYLAADAALHRLTADIASAAARIHSLVAAVKQHTHMDRAPTTDPIAIEEHLRDTVALMRSKASLKGASVDLTVEADLPPVEASVSELNQVWMHLLDNAIDAATDGGRIGIDARRDKATVVVRVVDDGPGIPDELQERVFEPFYTTKDVGEGRGLGLDIVRTVVRAHRGTVTLISIPGRTELRVTLPAAGSDMGG